VRSHGFQGVLGIRTALGTTQMRTEDDSCAVIQQVLDGGQSGADAGIVTNCIILQRDIEIHTDENPLALDFNITNGFLAEHASLTVSWQSWMPDRLCGRNIPTHCRTR